MSKSYPEDFDALIGEGTGLINPNQQGFQQLREAIVEHADQLSEEQKLKVRLQALKYRMDSYLSGHETESGLSAGEFLRAFVEAVGVKHATFARYLGLQPANLSAIYRGQRRISQELALKLGALFDMKPSLWLYLQSKSELLAIQEAEPEAYAGYRLEELIKAEK